jgi:uncharacterized alpha-E superfamily protein
MMFMIGNKVADGSEVLKEEEVLYNIGLNNDTPYSIINNVKYSRENANSARDLISTELYEAINKFYHFVLNYPVDDFVKRGLHDFTVNITEMTAVLRAKIRGTLLHDEVYAIIMMGINIERATQIIRIINTKFNDAVQAQGSYGDRVGNSFEWSTLLKCAESYDMMRRYYKKPPTSISTLEFLILNPDCPRSVMNSINQVHRHIKVLDQAHVPLKNSTSFLVSKMKAEYEFKCAEEIEEDIQGFIEKILESLVQIGQKMEKEFFNY